MRETWVRRPIPELHVLVLCEIIIFDILRATDCLGYDEPPGRTPVVVPLLGAMPVVEGFGDTTSQRQPGPLPGGRVVGPGDKGIGEEPPHVGDELQKACLLLPVRVEISEPAASLLVEGQNSMTLSHSALCSGA